MARIGTLEDRSRAVQSQPEGQGQMAARQGGGAIREDSPSALQRANRLGQAATTGAARLLGMPVYMANAALDRLGLGEYKQIGSSQDLLELGSKLGITFREDEKPEGYAERIAYELGAASLPTAGVLRLGRAAGSASQAITRGASEVTNKVGLVTQTARQAASKPGATTALEATSAAGAGTGAELANEIAPDSETFESLGLLMGGFTPSFLANFSVIGQLATKAARFVASPITGERSTQRAARRLQERVADPEAAVQQIDEQSGRGLTPARATGEKNLIDIENAVRFKYPEVDQQISDQLEDAIDGLVRESRQIGSLSGQARVKEILENRRDYLLGSLEVESAKAGEAYAVRLSQLGQDASSRQIQAAFDETVGTAYDTARSTERQLWNNVDTQGIADLQNTNKFYSGEVARRSAAADPEDIPDFVENLLDVDGRPTVNYLQDFRSRVLQNIRAERAKDAPNRNKIRLLTGLQENLMEDMRGALGQSDALDSAIQYSSDVNQRFMQGRIGKLLGFERTGASAVDPQDSINFILGGGTPTTNVEKTLNAVPESRENISDFLKNQYAVTSVKPDGRINTNKSNAFFQKYRTLLDQIPGLENELREAATRGQRSEQLLRRKETVSKLARDPKRATISLFLDEPIEDAMKNVLSSKNPTKEAARIRRKVQQDPEALEGLKSAYVDSIYNSAKTGKLDEETGEAIINGPKIINQAENTRAAAKTLGLSDEEIERTISIGRAISRANKRGNPNVKVDGSGAVVGDVQNYFLDSVAAIVGARAGARFGGSTAGGGLQAATRGSTALQKVFKFLTRDRAEEVLRAAQTDEKLYRSLLLTPTGSKARKDKLAERLRAFIPSAAVVATEEEDKEPARTGRVGTLPKKRQEGPKEENSPIRIPITRDSSDFEGQQ